MATILISGGSGLIGKALSAMLVKSGHSVIVLSRKKRADTDVRYALWNVEKQIIDKDAIRSADHIIHLAGAGVADKRWTQKRKQEIINSRTQSSALLMKALAETPNKVQSFISSSAIGWYGPDPVVPNPHPFTESAPHATDFLGNTCALWEESVQPVTTMGKRLVILRTGIVLSREGGALKEFLKPVNLGVASIFGNGRQVLSWIHITDLCRLYQAAIENEQLNGVYNAVSTLPVSNKMLMTELARKVKGNFYMPFHIPAFMLKAALGEMSIEVLKSATVSNQKISERFQFLYPSITAALNNLFKAKNT